MMSDDKISEALDLVELVEFTVISAINEASIQHYSDIMPDTLADAQSGRQNLPLGGMYRSLNNVRKLLRDVLNNQRAEIKPTSYHKANSLNYSQVDNSESVPDIAQSDGSVSRALRPEVVDESVARQAGFSKGPSKAEGGQTEALTRKASGLASRIRPVPDEVRGRVRELVDMLEEEDLNSEQFKETRA